MTVTPTRMFDDLAIFTQRVKSSPNSVSVREITFRYAVPDLLDVRMPVRMSTCPHIRYVCSYHLI